jgi:hypothetical protein
MAARLPTIYREFTDVNPDSLDSPQQLGSIGFALQRLNVVTLDSEGRNSLMLVFPLNRSFECASHRPFGTTGAGATADPA